MHYTNRHVEEWSSHFVGWMVMTSIDQITLVTPNEYGTILDSHAKHAKRDFDLRKKVSSNTEKKKNSTKCLQGKSRTI